MSLQQGSTLDSAKMVSTYLLREPVKEAVKEALREETAAVETADSVTVEEESDSDEGGRSKLSMMTVLLVVGGLAFVARRRMKSESSGQSDEQPGDFEGASHGTTGDVGSSTATVSDET